ncbi:MAG: hypothetical protein IKW68_01155 [Clostridia bacterium]|nr:hypothetical protein [Clostridia bacterium]
MSALQICGAGVLAATVAVILRDARAPHPEALSVVFAVLVMGRVLMNTGTVVSFISDVSKGTATAEHISILLKAAGIAFVVDMASEICRTAGEGTVASYVETFGRFELIVLTLPVVSDLLELSMGLLQL